MNKWMALFINAALIILAGTQLSKNAERISSGLGLSSARAGALLLPLSTSLPEPVTSRRAAIIGVPDPAGGDIYGSRMGFPETAIGNVFGANFFNILLLFCTDFLSPGSADERPLSAKAAFTPSWLL